MTRQQFRLSAILYLSCSVLATPVLAQEFESASGTKVTIYGQLNFGVQYYDDGEDSKTNFADSNVSTSRVGLNYDIPNGEDRFRFQFETSLGFPRSDNFSQLDDPDFDWTKENLRKIDLSYSSARFGKVSAGQGSMATDDLAKMRLSGTSVVATANPNELAGNFEFIQDGELSGVEIDDGFTDFDGPRAGRIRYDTPEFSGFTLSAAWGEEILKNGDDTKFYDVALRYEQEFGDYEVVAGIGHLWTKPDVDDDEDDDTIGQFVGSGAIKHTPSGISLNIAGGDEEDGGSYGWAQLAWEGDLISAGSTSFSIDYWDGSDFNVDGSDSDAWTIAAVQKIDDWSIEAYIAYRRYSYDDDGGSYKDGDLIFAGARWRF